MPEYPIIITKNGIDSLSLASDESPASGYSLSYVVDNIDYTAFRPANTGSFYIEFNSTFDFDSIVLKVIGSTAINLTIAYSGGSTITTSSITSGVKYIALGSTVQDSSRYRIMFSTSGSDFELIHLWCGNALTIKDPVQPFDPDRVLVDIEKFDNGNGINIKNTINFRRKILQGTWTNVSGTVKTNFENLKTNSFLTGTPFWFFFRPTTDNTSGNLFTFDQDEFALDYNTGVQRTLSIRALADYVLNPSIQPANQPTTFVFSNITQTAMDVSFTAAADNPAGYIVVMKVGSAPTWNPTDGVTYALSQVVADGTTVVKFGSGTTFSVSGQSSDTQLFFRAFSWNGTTDTYDYLTSSPLTGSKYTLDAEPTAQATGLTLEDTGVARRVEINFTEASPTADGYILVRRLTSASNVTPVDGTVYSDGATLGTDVYVVHMGAYSDFSGGYTDMSGLIGIDNYTYYVYAYNGSTSPNYYLTGAPSATISFLQPSSQPTNLVLTQTSTSPNIVTVTFDEVAGVQFYLVVRRLTASGAPDNPVDGTEYADDATYGSGNTRVVHAGHYSDFDGSGWEDDQASLTDADWTWAVYAYNYGDVPNYLTTSPLTDNLVVT